jgi:hypothetical protein
MLRTEQGRGVVGWSRPEQLAELLRKELRLPA